MDKADRIQLINKYLFEQAGAAKPVLQTAKKFAPTLIRDILIQLGISTALNAMNRPEEKTGPRLMSAPVTSTLPVSSTFQSPRTDTGKGKRTFATIGGKYIYGE